MLTDQKKKTCFSRLYEASVKKANFSQAFSKTDPEINSG